VNDQKDAYMHEHRCQYRLEISPYLLNINCIKHRVCITKLRAEAHNLRMVRTISLDFSNFSQKNLRQLI
jgi:hypothetical protein